MSKRNDEYFLLCITDSSDAIVGTGALIVERKFIHQLGLVGHIEDIAVAKDQQGKKLGLRIIQALDFVAEKVGCYKVRTGGNASGGRDRRSPMVRGKVHMLTNLVDNSRLLGSERGLLRQVRVQEGGFGDGALLRPVRKDHNRRTGCDAEHS
jgi:GNAT superfamily N-acetyltransferase